MAYAGLFLLGVGLGILAPTIGRWVRRGPDFYDEE